MALVAGLSAVLPAQAGPGATRVGAVDDAGWGQLAGVLAEVHGEPEVWSPPDEAAQPALGPVLADADARERALDLPGALSAYTAACAADPGETPSSRDRWQRGCEGAVRMAFGVEDPAALDEALGRLLRRRPDHPFPPETFPPPVAARARHIAERLPRSTLTVDGNPGTVHVDGVPRGQAPLRWSGVPAGEHEIQCAGWSTRISVEAGGTAVLRCPPADDAGDVRAVLVAHAGNGEHWVLVGEDAGALPMTPGTWVFHGGETSVGLWVGAVPQAPAILAWEQRVREAIRP